MSSLPVDEIDDALLINTTSLASFPMVWMDQYDQEPGPASLNYISLGVGFIIGLQISGPLIDKVGNVGRLLCLCTLENPIPF